MADQQIQNVSSKRKMGSDSQEPRPRKATKKTKGVPAVPVDDDSAVVNVGAGESAEVAATAAVLAATAASPTSEAAAVPQQQQ